jgi:integrase
MPRPRLKIPAYRQLSSGRAAGRAAVTVYKSNGSRTEVILPGLFGSDESKAEYERILAVLRANTGTLPDKNCKAPDLNIVELIDRFMEERVATYYVNPATKEATGEQENFASAMRPLNRLFGSLTVADFGPQCLITVRQSMIDGRWMTDEEREEWIKKGRKIGMARRTINGLIGRIKMMFKWATKMQIIPPSIFHGLLAVDGLARGRSAARENDDVRPVPLTILEATQSHLPPVVRDIVDILLLTGMRVGEAVIMRGIDIDMSGPVWLFSPTEHKNKWRGHHRVIAIGPKAQAIIRRYLKPKIDAYFFSPREQRDMIFTAKREARKTKVQPSQLCRKKAKPKKLPGESFDAVTINHAIRSACKKARVPRWHTHQLRHTAALEISRQHGLEAARAILGHRTVQMSAHYSGIDQITAAQVMAKIG